MKKNILLIIFCSLFLSYINGQNNFWFGSDFGVDYDIYKINDAGMYLSENPVIAGHVGIIVEKEFNADFSIGSGFIFKTYRESIKFKDDLFSSADRAFNSLIVPLNFKYRLPLKNSLFKIVTNAGGDIVYNFDYWEDPNVWYGSSTFTLENGTSVSQDFYGNANIKRFFILLHAGGGIEFNVFKKCRFSFLVNRFFGFTHVVEVTTDYIVNGTEYPSASLNSKGSFMATSLQFFYSLNNPIN